MRRAKLGNAFGHSIFLSIERNISVSLAYQVGGCTVTLDQSLHDPNQWIRFR